MATVTMNSLSLPSFSGLRPNTPSATPPVSLLHSTFAAAAQPMGRRQGKGALGAKCGFIGSPTNLIMVSTTSLMLFAGRFGLAPSANRKATAGLKLEARESGLQTGDPAGFTLADTLACGSVGHIIGVGVVLGLKNLGVI
ncbi:photosystem I reaction center subunit psaK, chloroplastic [Malania oleifera]|uniref:photosystem I reaction center subunit psaK, chloroplastic n=1 Tax=Malania oleifera TaxID=397392 RepID=UPI0025ADD782|nr:photosystem I reaction center subunit psaK, chloroplastic [Malania oleifera]